MKIQITQATANKTTNEPIIIPSMNGPTRITTIRRVSKVKESSTGNESATNFDLAESFTNFCIRMFKCFLCIELVLLAYKLATYDLSKCIGDSMVERCSKLTDEDAQFEVHEYCWAIRFNQRKYTNLIYKILSFLLGIQIVDDECLNSTVSDLVSQMNYYHEVTMGIRADVFVIVMLVACMRITLFISTRIKKNGLCKFVFSSINAALLIYLIFTLKLLLCGQFSFVREASAFEWSNLVPNFYYPRVEYAISALSSFNIYGVTDYSIHDLEDSIAWPYFINRVFNAFYFLFLMLLPAYTMLSIYRAIRFVITRPKRTTVHRSSGVFNNLRSVQIPVLKSDEDKQLLIEV